MGGQALIKMLRYPRPGMLFLAWTLVGLVGYARYARYTPYAQEAVKSGLAVSLLTWLVCYYAWFLMTPLLVALERRFPLPHARWPAHAAVLALAGAPFAYAAFVIGIALAALVRAMWHVSPLQTDPLWPMPWTELLAGLTLYSFTVGIASMMRNAVALRETERRTAQLMLEKWQLENALQLAQLETLRSRLNPHFLFNALQGISTLARHEPRTASTMLARLGDLLRISLRKHVEAETTLAEELDLTRAYVAIETMRFGDRLEVQYDVPGDLTSALVPSFLLQPLVENAITHGFANAGKDGLVTVRARSEGNDLVLTIDDNGTGLAVGQGPMVEVGVGVGTTRERLARMYPGRGELSLRSRDEGGTQVRLRLPLRLKECSAEGANDDVATTDCR